MLKNNRHKWGLYLTYTGPSQVEGQPGQLRETDTLEKRYSSVVESLPNLVCMWLRFKPQKKKDTNKIGLNIMKPQVRSYLVQSSNKATQSQWHEKSWAFHILLKEPVGCRLESNAANKNSQWNKDLWLNGIVESQAGATNPELHPGHDKQCSSGKCPDWGTGVLAAGLYQEVDLVTERRNGPPRDSAAEAKIPELQEGSSDF